MSHLYNLYRRREKKNKHQREDFASTALAWLVQREQQACRLLLAELGVEAPSDLSRRAIHTQVGLYGKRPDLLIHVATDDGSWSLYVECKLDLTVDQSVAKQIRTYQRLSGKAVALLCKREQLPSDGDVAWADIPHRGSWEGLAERLREDSRRHDPHVVHDLRHDFLDLAKALGVAGEDKLTDPQVRRGMAAQLRVGGWGDGMRAALRSLLPDTGEDSADPWVWSLDGPVSGTWAKDRAPPNLGFSGIALCGDPAGVGELPWVRWYGYLYPSTTVRTERWARAEKAGWVKEDSGWWCRELSTAFDPDEPGNDVLRRSSDELRSTLADDIGLDLPPVAWKGDPRLAGPLAGGSRDLTLARVVSARLSRVSDEALQALHSHLHTRFQHHAYLSKRGRDKVFVDAQAGWRREFGTWQYLTGSEAGIGFWCWLGGKRTHDRVEKSMGKLAKRLGVTICRAKKSRSRLYHVLVPAMPVDTLDTRVHVVAEGVAAWVWKNRDRIAAVAPDHA